MKILIPLAGECEINELKHDFYTDTDVPLEDDFIVINKDNQKFCFCDPGVSTALCKHLFHEDPFVLPLIDFYSPGEAFWFYARNERCTPTAEELPFGNIFDLYVEYGFIKKIVDEKLKKITSGPNFIFVYSDVYFKPTTEFYEKLFNLAKVDADDIKATRLEWIEDYDDKDEDEVEQHNELLDEINEDYEICINHLNLAFAAAKAKI